MLILMYLPIVILAVYSFTDTANIGAIRGFSIRNYVTLFTLPELTPAQPLCVTMVFPGDVSPITPHLFYQFCDFGIFVWWIVQIFVTLAPNIHL